MKTAHLFTTILPYTIPFLLCFAASRFFILMRSTLFKIYVRRIVVRADTCKAYWRRSVRKDVGNLNVVVTRYCQMLTDTHVSRAITLL
jgi:hypothetical protein